MARSCSCRSTRWASGAYQVAVLSLIVTMLIGALAHRADRGASARMRRTSTCRTRPCRRLRSRPRAARGRSLARSLSRRSPRGAPVATPTRSRSSRRAWSVRAPAEGVRRPPVRGDEHGRVAGSSRTDAVRDRPAGDALRGAEDVPHREPVAAAEVADQRIRRRRRPRVTGPGQLQRAQVRVRQVRDVDVVADRACRRASGSRRRTASAAALRRPPRARSG